ncbi:hypothetical protein N0B28_14350 [Pseudomonas sp. SD17-1]|uniref:DUF6756 family protein n=1 Tax=Pseudomonas TaxID=286 RepID=UPI0020CC0405|nr:MULTISPECIES: DUF6756 family protein [Pseudomonas]WEJ19480.1 hypothetical protein N0B28_14350 [Pseudomonas sp. SD17-1]
MCESEEINLRSELSAALVSEGLSPNEIEDKERVTSLIEKRFISGTPRAWWLSLVSKPEVYSFPDNSGYQNLLEIFPAGNDKVWFVVDDDNKEKFVFFIPLNKVQDIIESCRFFEYYVVDENISWMLAENDHGEILVCRGGSL